MNAGDDRETPAAGLPAPTLDQLLAATTPEPPPIPVDAPEPGRPSVRSVFDPAIEASAAGGPGEMTGGPAASPTSDDPASTIPPQPSTVTPVRRADEPLLPAAPAKPPPAMTERGNRPSPGAATWYRSDEQRNKSVRRRANPWYRRLARGIVGLTFLAAGAVGLYFGARLVQDWLDRDRLPAAGPEVPAIGATSFQVSSVAPAPAVDGTLTIDTGSLAFEFVGRAGGPQAGLQVVSPNGTTVFVRQGGGAWEQAESAGQAVVAQVNDLQRTVDNLADHETADTILTNALRRGYVELRQQIGEGVGDDELTRYEIEIDTQAFSVDYPLQWQDFQLNAIPGAPATNDFPAAIWVDTDDVVVRVRAGADGGDFWSWQRLTYSTQPFTPVDPSSGPVGLLPCVPETGVGFSTERASCADAIAAGRDLAVANGLAAAGDTAAADLAFTTACRAIQNTEAVRTAILPASVELANQLHATGVCPGDLSRLESGS